MDINWQELFARRAKRITGSQIRQFFSLTERPEVISFAGGFPGSDFFPREDISRTLAGLIREEGRSALQYSPTEGNFELRVYLAGKMRREGYACEAENIIVVDGAQQGLDLLCRILVNPGDAVLVEEPAYIGGMGAIQSYGGTPVGIAMDADGLLPEAMENTIQKLTRQGQAPKVLYTVANFHNPTGYTTSQARREAVMALARRYNLLVIEDNPYGEICYEGTVPDSYKSMDRDGRVIYLGSYSKTFIPGIRIGWIAGALPLLEKVTLAKQTTDLCSSSLGQRLVYRLSQEGYVDRHVKRLIGLYRRNRDVMLESMDQFFPPEISFSRPKGGFFVWVDFPRSFPPARELLTAAIERNVAFVHGEGFSSNGGGTHSARFSFSQPGVDDICRGIDRLGELFYEVSEQTGRKAASG
jgi:2-aminoadipate transaminase